MLELKNINFIYDKELLSMYEETKAAAAGIHDINFTVYDNDFIGIIYCSPLSMLLLSLEYT